MTVTRPTAAAASVSFASFISHISHSPKPTCHPNAIQHAKSPLSDIYTYIRQYVCPFSPRPPNVYNFLAAELLYQFSPASPLTALPLTLATCFPNHITCEKIITVTFEAMLRVTSASHSLALAALLYQRSSNFLSSKSLDAVTFRRQKHSLIIRHTR